MSDKSDEKPVVNCYNGTGTCVFSAIPRNGADIERANELGKMIVKNSDVVHDFVVATENEGPIVKY